MSDLYSIYPFTSNAFNLLAMDMQEWMPNIQPTKVHVGGSLDPAMVAASYYEPSARIGTTDLATLLANVSLLRGKKLTSWAMQFQQRAEAGGAGDFTTGSTHAAVKSVSGCPACMVVDSISAEKDQRDPVSANCSLFMYSSNGRTVPFTVGTSEALSQSPAIGKTYALGPILREGLTGGPAGAQRAEVNFGTPIVPDRDAGKTCPIRGTVGNRNPTISVDAESVAIGALLGAIAKTQDVGGGMTVYLQRLLHGSDRYAFDQSEHIAIGFTTGAYLTQSIGVNKDGNAMTRFTAHITGQIAVVVNTTITVP